MASGEGGSDEITQSIEVKEPAPIASFTFSPDNPKAGEEVTFTNTSTNAASYLWTFTPQAANGARISAESFSSTLENPVVVFPSEGNWSVVLQAIGPGGSSESSPLVLAVAPATIGGGGGDTGEDNPCNLPNCFVSQTVSTVSGSSVTTNYTYRIVSGKKVLDKLEIVSGGGGFSITTTTVYEYNAQAQEIRSTTSSTIFGNTTISVIIESEYDNLGRLSRENTRNASGALESYEVYSYLGSSKNIDRIESFNAAGVLQDYSIYDQYNGSEYGRVRSFSGAGVLESTATYTWENCQPKTIVAVDAASGTTLLNQVNEFGANRLISRSTSTVRDTSGGIETTAVTTYSYQCD